MTEETERRIEDEIITIQTAIKKVNTADADSIRKMVSSVKECCEVITKCLTR